MNFINECNDFIIYVIVFNTLFFWWNIFDQKNKNEQTNVSQYEFQFYRANFWFYWKQQNSHKNDFYICRVFLHIYDNCRNNICNCFRLKCVHITQINYESKYKNFDIHNVRKKIFFLNNENNKKFWIFCFWQYAQTKLHQNEKIFNKSANKSQIKLFEFTNIVEVNEKRKTKTNDLLM